MRAIRSFEIPDAYLFLKRSARLLFYKKQRGVGRYGVQDLVSGEALELRQSVEKANHRESIMFVTANQTKIVYYAKFERIVQINSEKRKKKEGIVQINSLETGELFGAIQCDEEMLHNKIALSPRWCLSADTNKVRSLEFVDKNPLKHVHAIAYNDFENEVYTANRAGEGHYIYLWA